MEPVKKNIDGVDFIIRKMNVFDGWRVLAALQKTVAPGLISLFAGGLSNAGDAASELSERITPEEFDSICNLLFFKHEKIAFSANGLETVKLNKNNSDEAFKTMSSVLELAEAVIRLNYEDFFRKAIARFGMGGGKVDQEALSE